MRKVFLCLTSLLLTASVSGPVAADYKKKIVASGDVTDITGAPQIDREGAEQCAYRRIVRAKVLRGSRLGHFELVEASGTIPYVAKIGYDSCFGKVLNYNYIRFRSENIVGVENVTLRVIYDDHSSEEINLKIIVPSNKRTKPD